MRKPWTANLEIPMSNLRPEITENEKGFIVTLYEGDEVVFTTTTIPHSYKLIADMVHSTLEVAIAFGFFKEPTENRD